MDKIDLIIAPRPFFNGMCEQHLKLLAELARPLVIAVRNTGFEIDDACIHPASIDL